MIETIYREFITYGNFHNVLFLIFLCIVLYLAWLTTGIEPLNYRLWVAQLFSLSTHQVIQLHDLNRLNCRHVFWRSPFVFNSNPRVTTVVLVQRPAEANLPSTRNVPFDYFTEGGNDNPDAEQQRLIADFISQNVGTNFNYPGNTEPQDIGTEPTSNYIIEDSNGWRALADIVQQAQVANSNVSETSPSPPSDTTPTNTTLNTNPSNPTSTSPPHSSTQTSINHHRVMMSPNSSAPGEDDFVTIKLKHPDDSVTAVKTKLNTSVSAFKSQSFTENDAPKTKLIFQRKTLEDESQTLGFYGFYDQCLVHFVTLVEDENEISNTITVRLKHLDDRYVHVNVLPSITVGEFKSTNFTEEINNGKFIRLIFQGQLLRNDLRTLASYGIVDSSVVHVQIGQQPYRQEGTTQQSPAQNTNDPTEIFANPHLVVTGIAWLDSALLTFLSTILMVVRWAEADDVLEEDNSLLTRISRGLRSAIRYLTNFLAFMFVPQDNDVDVQHQFGVMFNFFVMLKILILVGLCFIYPHMIDTKSVILVTIISVFALMYLWSNRPRRGDAVM